MTRNPDSREQRSIQVLATVLVGLMVLSVVAAPALATGAHESTPERSVEGPAADAAVTQQEGANQSLSIPGRSWATADGAGSTSADVSGEFTIEFWVRYNETSDEDAVVLSKGGIPDDTSGNYLAYLQGTGDGRQITFAFNNFAGSITSNTEIPANQWTHVAVTYDGSTQTLYLNGEQDAQRGESSSPDTTEDDFNIGVNDAKSGNFLDGRVDNVRIWSDFRNLIEIEDNVYTDLSGNEQGLQALWQFDGGLNDQVGGSDLSTAGDTELVGPDANPVPPFLHTVPGNDSVTLHWTERTGPSGENTADSFEIYRSTSPSFTSQSQNLIATVAGGVTTYEDTAVNAGTTYYYQIRSVDANGEAGGFEKATVARPYVERGGGSFDVDGRGYGVVSDRPTLEIGNHDEFAVEFWVNYNASSDEDAVVLSKGGIPGQSSGSYTAFLEGTGEARQLTFTFNNFADSITSSTEIQAGRWTHVAVTYDGSTQTLYLNGEQDAQRGENSLPSPNDADLHVGVDDSQSGHFLDGRVDDVRLWRTNRQQSEIRDNYRTRLDGDESGLLNYWRFNAIGETDEIRSSESKKSAASLEGDAAIESGGVYPVAPYVFATSENAASNVSYENRMSEPLDSVHYQLTVGDAPTAGAGTQFQPSAFTPRDVAGLTNGVTYEHYLQAEVDGQRSDFQRAATSTPYAERGGSSLTLGDESYGTASDRPTLDIDDDRFTIEFWVKYDASSDEDAVVLSKGGIPGDSSGNYQAYLAGDGEDRRIQFTFNNFHDDLQSNGGIPADVWTHVAYTWDGSTQSIYIDGELDTQSSDNSNPSGVSAPLRIGTDQPATAHYLEGHVDEVAIWNDTRTDQEIADSYVNGFVGNESGLEHYWRFDESDRSESRGSTDWHATVETRDGAELSAPGVLPVPPRAYARGESGQAEVVWRVRNRPDDVFVYASDNRDRSDRTLTFQADADQQSTFIDRQVTNDQTVFYETTSLTRDGQESDYSFPASALPSDNIAGNAFEFDGQSSHITVEDRPALDVSSDFSIEFWVKYNETSDGDAVVLSKGGIPGDSSGNYQAYLVGGGADRPIQFTFNNFHDDLQSSSSISAGEWTYVAYTWDGSTQSIYIDGELDTQSSDNSNPSGVSAPLRIGTDQPATAHYLQGQVDEVRITDEPRRSQADIRATFDRELVGDEAGLEGYWRGCYSPQSDSVWGHARKPMTAEFVAISCGPSTINLDRGSLTSTFNVTLDGGTNGLNSYLIEVETGADTAIRTVEPDVLGGTRFRIVDGGPGEANVTATASEETGIVGPSEETRTLFQIEYSGNVTRDDLRLNVVELSDDDNEQIPSSAVGLAKISTEGDTGDGEGVSVALQPADGTVGVGGQATFDVVIDDIDAGVGSYDVEVNLTDTSQARIIGATDEIGGSDTIAVAGDGSGVKLGTFAGDTADTGPVTVATVTVEGVATGDADLSVTANSISDTDGNSYDIGTEIGANLEVVEGIVAPDVTGDGNPATDPDGDGLYEDLNGDGSVTPGDATVLFNAVFGSNPAVVDNSELFDFNQDGSLAPGDATVLFQEAFRS